MLTFRNIKTVLQLKKFVERGADSFYFSADEMEGFGDTFSNYGVRHIRLKRRDADDVINAIELYRKKPVKHNCQQSVFFELTSEGIADVVWGQTT